VEVVPFRVLAQDSPSLNRMVSVSASVNLLSQHKVQKFSSGTGSLGWSRKKDRKTVVVVVLCVGKTVVHVIVNHAVIL